MQRFTSYILIGLLMLHTLAQVLIVGDFVINQDFIATNLCENIEKPELKCNGKCHLAKELQTTETKDTEQTNPSFEFSAYIPLSVFQVDGKNEVEFNIPKKEFLTTRENILSGYGHSVFHPPC